jgi:hypothetical protein
METIDGETNVEEAICPFCNKAIRSDASCAESCALCGMGIDHPELAPSRTLDSDEVAYYCCIWCLKVHTRMLRSDRELTNIDDDDNKGDGRGQVIGRGLRDHREVGC